MRQYVEECMRYYGEGKGSSLESVRWSHYCDLPLEQVAVVYQASREAVHGSLCEFCEH